MLLGTADLIIIVLVFVGLQFWWIIPIIKNNNKINYKGKELTDLDKQLDIRESEIYREEELIKFSKDL